MLKSPAIHASAGQGGLSYGQSTIYEAYKSCKSYKSHKFYKSYKFYKQGGRYSTTTVFLYFILGWFC